MTEVGRISIRVVPDLKRFREELYGELKKAEQGAKVEVKADFDENGLREKVAAAAKAADAHTKVRVDVNTDYMKGKILEDLRNFKAKVKVDVDVDRSLLSRLRGVSRGGPGSLGGGGGSGVGGLGSIANFGSPLNLLAIAALLPPALAIVAPALASLPAALSALVLPVGTLALGMDGLKKAAENAGVAVAGKKGKLSAAGALKQLQEGVSGVFEQGFTPILTQLISVSPQVTTALKGVAQGIVNLAQGAVNALTSPQGQNQLNTLSANIGGLLSAAAPGMQSFTTGLINLATQVSTHFPGLADWFNKLGEKFSNWVDKISKDGTLDGAISSMRPVLDSVVGFVGKLVDAGLKLAADPAMVSNIKTVFDSITNFVVSSLPALTQTFEALASLLHSLGLDKGNPSLGRRPGDGSPSGPNGLLPAAPGSDGKFSWWTPEPKVAVPYGKQGFLDQLETDPLRRLGLKDFPGWMDEHIGGPILRFFTGKTQNQQGFGGPDSMFGKTTNALGNFFTGNSQWEKTIAGNVGNLPQTLQGLASPGGQLDIAGLKIPTGQLVQQATDAVNQVKGVFESLPGAVSGIWDGIVSTARSSMSQFASAVSSGIDNAVSFFTSLAGRAVAAVQNMGSQLFSAGAAAMQRLNEGLKSVPIVGPVISGLEGILKNIPHSPAAEGPMSGAGWTALFTGGQAIGNQFRTGLEDGFQGVISSATDLLGQVHGALDKGGALPPGLKQNLRDELKAIRTEYDTLKVQRDALAPNDKSGRKAISDQMRQLQTLRDQLKLGRDLLPDAKKPTAKSDMDIGQMFGQQLEKLPNIGSNFAMANINQFEQDLGMSGNGAIPTIANAGIGWLNSTLGKMISGAFGNSGGANSGGGVNIQVNSVDDALAAHRNIVNKQAMQYAGR